ncbi:MAG: phage terminase large subunit [Undibacterium sp.]|uniref:phage terminase large subunit n=1 Tax=Undibacterium sp. TaxID=1914977 RepID=UPI00271C0DB0|nr:phage terminase large subunit [Undibacterium sp.]MDO8654202.1 phage terminase large subunit [Undibacterium sp.]
MKLKDLKLQIAALAGQFRLQIEAECDGFNPNPAESAKRVKQAQNDYEFFARTYFPHYIKHDNAVLHDYLYKRLPELVDAPEGQHEVIAAPRGNAKSTLVTQIFTIWCVVTGRKRYPLIIMDALDQAATMLEAIKAELEFNPRLTMDYPKASGQGRVWQVGTITTNNDVKIQAFGSGKRMRGLRHGPHRPDLVIGDDLENDENVRSPEQRDKLESWLKKTVLSLGPADDSMDVIVIGTILHYDSVLSRLLGNKLWKRRKFKAVIEWPHRMDLWDKWEEILLNTDDEGVAAQAFYQERRVQMELGAIICWPAGQPLYKLMLKRARDGHSAFDSEQQNDPVSGEDAPFANVIQFWVNRLNEWVFYGACDPSLGKSGASRDPSALLIGGGNRTTGVLCVVEAKIAKRVPDKIIEDIISLQREYRCISWVVESVQFQEFLRTELVKRSALRGVPVPATAVTPHTDKILRIESLQPHVANGLILLHPSQTTLIEQLRHFPKADHDDGPDALHMLWAAFVSRLGGFEHKSSGIRRAGSGMSDYVNG